MKPWMWAVLGIGIGVAALWLYQKRQAAEFALTHQDQIAGVANIISGSQDVWSGIEQVLGKKTN
jgi:hypothetical protein